MKKKRMIRFLSAAMCFALLVLLCPPELAPVQSVSAAETHWNSFRCEPVDILFFGTYYDNIDTTWNNHPEKFFKKASDVLDPITLNIDNEGNFSVKVPKNREMVCDDTPSNRRGVFGEYTMSGALCCDSNNEPYKGGGLFAKVSTDNGISYITYKTKKDTGKCTPASISYTLTDENGRVTACTFKPTTASVKTGYGDLAYLRGETRKPADELTATVSVYLFGVMYDSKGEVVDDTVKVQCLYEAKNIPQKAEEEPKDGDLYLYGTVKNAAGEKMSGLDMRVQGVFESDPDTAFCEVNLTTDKNGEYKTTPMTIPAAVIDPALKLTLKMQYIPYGRTPYVIFTDNADTKLEDGEVITVTALIKLDQKKIDELKKGELKYQQFDIDFKWLLSKYKPRINILSKNANDFTTNLSDSITVKTSAGRQTLTAAERLANASILYNAAADAYNFASETLGEKENMQRSLTVKLRSKEVTDPSSAHYDPVTFSINLGADTSMRDDDSLCTILHEFGHAFDHFTSGNQYFHLNNTYDEKNKKWLDINHFGIFNATMNDSYTEGFANFFAAMVRKSKGLKNPEKLVRSDLSIFANNYAYNNASYGSSYEENAIASFLYNAEESIGDVKKMWSVLKPDRGSFKEYYDAVIGLMTADEQERFKEISMWLGLHTMPYEGNGVYDYGEPFLDENENEEYDEGEPFYDLVFKQEYYEEMGGYVPIIDDEDKWVENYDKIVFGSVADYKRSGIRKNFPLPDVGYMSIEAADGAQLPEYYLVTVNIPDEGTYTSLRRIFGGGIFLFDPNVTTNGTITVSIPGGGEIFSGDIWQIGNDALSYGKDYYAACATVTADKLAPDGVIAVPTYGESTASGYIDISENAGVFGDLDGDGEITANDALTILRSSVGMADLTPEQTKLADVDSDGEITANDALAVLRYSVGMANEDSPINNPAAA